MKSILCVLLLTAFALTAADLTGKWGGSFDVTTAAGETKPDTTYLNLKISGGTVTGTAGPNETTQMEIKNGKLAGEKLTRRFTARRPGLSKAVRR